MIDTKLYDRIENTEIIANNSTTRASEALTIKFALSNLFF